MREAVSIRATVQLAQGLERCVSMTPASVSASTETVSHDILATWVSSESTLWTLSLYPDVGAPGPVAHTDPRFRVQEERAAVLLWARREEKAGRAKAQKRRQGRTLEAGRWHLPAIGCSTGLCPDVDECVSEPSSGRRLMPHGG